MPDLDPDAAIRAASSMLRLVSGPAADSAAGGADNLAGPAAAMPGDAAGTLITISDAGSWIERLVPPGFTPPAAALLALAVGLVCWLLGGRHLRGVLAVGGGLAAAALAWWILPGPAAGAQPEPPGMDVAGPVLAAGLGGAAAAFLLSRVLLAASLSLVMAAMAPTAFIAWGSIAAGLPGPASAAASEGPKPATNRIVIRGDEISRESLGERLVAKVSALESRLVQSAAPQLGLLEASSGAGSPGPAAGPGLGPGFGGIDPAVADGLGLTAATRRVVQRLEARGRSLLARMPATRNPGDRRLLPWLALAGAAGGVLVAVVRREIAARIATAGVGAALVLLGGLHLPRGLVAGGWIGPDRPDLTLTAWILLSALGIAVQWSYRPRTADIGR